MHVIAAKAVAFGEALQPDFKTYAKAVIANARTLAGRLKELPVPVAAAVLSYFRLRRRHRGDVPSPRATGELRAYVELVDNSYRGRTRLDWETELAELRARGARYGRPRAVSSLMNPFTMSITCCLVVPGSSPMNVYGKLLPTLLSCGGK